MKLLYVLFFAIVFAAVAQAKERPPNIVYIIADDQSWTDFGFMGNERVYTPNLDRFAEQSAAFVNGYLPSSVCRPSLVTLMTGLFPHEHGVYFNHGPPGNSAYNRMTSRDEYEETRKREFKFIRNVPTLPRVLASEKGYRSLQTGKFWEGHWKNAGFTEGMTTFKAPPPTQTYGGIRKLANGELVAHGNGDAGLQIGRETMKPICDFVLDCEKSSSPWMVWYAPYLPHQPHDSPETFYELAAEMPGVQEHELPYFASIAQFDATVGELVSFVEDNADPENTIFVFVSDNGWSPSERREKKRPEEFAHTKNSKRAPFDEGVRSPILIRWDGVVEPQRRTELVSSVDLVPTLLSAAGISGKAGVTGHDLIAELKEDSLSEDRAVFGEIYPGDATEPIRPEQDIAYRWVRKGDFKLIVTHGKNPWGGYLSGDALFDVANDPAETTNLIEDKRFQEVVSELRQELDSWWTPIRE